MAASKTIVINIPPYGQKIITYRLYRLRTLSADVGKWWSKVRMSSPSPCTHSGKRVGVSWGVWHWLCAKYIASKSSLRHSYNSHDQLASTQEVIINRIRLFVTEIGEQWGLHLSGLFFWTSGTHREGRKLELGTVSYDKFFRNYPSRFDNLG